jgi:hydrogenase nickel incorporation protein HypA/HybF
MMHELSIMQGALDQVLDEARKAGTDRVLEIRLRIGVLSGVVPEALQFAFEALADGTPAQDATLIVENISARFWCEKCRREFNAISVIAQCPSCKNLSRELRAGRELELASMEVA